MGRRALSLSTLWSKKILQRSILDFILNIWASDLSQSCFRDFCSLLNVANGHRRQLCYSRYTQEAKMLSSMKMPFFYFQFEMCLHFGYFTAGDVYMWVVTAFRWTLISWYSGNIYRLPFLLSNAVFYSETKHSGHANFSWLRCQLKNTEDVKSVSHQEFFKS